MKLKYILWSLAGLVLALLLIILLPIDDKLDAEAAAWAERANDIEDVEGNGYYYLMGIMAGASEDPETVGKAIIADYRDAEQKFLRGEVKEFSQQEYPKSKQLPEPEGNYYCRMEDPGCFSRLAANPAALRAELKTHAVLLQRYQRYLQFNRVKNLVKPMLYERFPAYGHLGHGHKLNQLRILLESLEGNHKHAISMLYEDIEQIRRDLAVASHLLGKMIMLRMLADDLDLLFNLARQSDSLPPIPALTPEERALEQAMIHEFGYLGNFFTQMEQNPDSLEGDFSDFDWLIRASIKPNMSMNGLFPYYRDIAALSALDASEFNGRLAAGEPKVDTGFNLRNIGGSILNSVSAPSLSGYVARIHDVDCKIALLNVALKLDAPAWNKILKGEAELQANNPYNSSWRPFIVPETQAVCFKGPFDDLQERRCIRKDKAI